MNYNIFLKSKILTCLLFVIAFGFQSIQAQSNLCSSSATTFGYEYVSNVTINGVSTNTNIQSFSSGPGYLDYSANNLTNLVAGQTYPISVTVEANSTYQEFVKVWFDFNGNGDLQDSGELIFDQVKTFSGTQVYSGNFTVPTNAFNGTVFIRAIMVYAATPKLCGSYTYGNTLDFKATISGGLVSRTLTTSTTGTGGANGTVTSSPSGINTSSGNTSAFFEDGSNVTLTANPNPGFAFTGWSGDATGTSTSISVPMDANKNVVANFGPACTAPTFQNTNALIQAFSDSNCKVLVTYPLLISGTSPTTSYEFTGATIGNGSGPGSGKAFKTGTTHVIVTANNSCGNIQTEFDVTVTDNTAPTVLTNDISVILDSNGNASITPEMIDNGSTDACGIASISIDKTNFDCSNFGDNTVTLTVTDVNGNVNTATATVNVNDGSSKSSFDQADYINIGNSSYLGNAQYKLTSAVNTQFGGVWYQNKLDLSSDFELDFDIYLGTSDFGADGMAFVLQPLSTNEGASGGGLGYLGINPSLAVEFDTYQNNEAADPAADHVALTQNGNILHNSGNTLSGPHAVSNLENGAYHNVKISWNHTTNNLVVVFKGSTIINYTGDVVNNIFSGNSGVFWGFTAATGGFNNEHRVKINTVSFVEELSITSQLITPAACSESLDGAIDISVSQDSPCISYSWSNGETTQDISNLNPGEYTVTISKPDGTFTSQTFTVEGDTTPPTVVVQDISVDLDPAGSATITAAMIDNGSSDACGIASYNLDITSFDCANVGVPNVVTLTVTDSNGNVSNATANVTVNDVTAPLVVTQDIVVDLDANGSAIITVSDIDNGSNDSCGIASYDLDVTTFSCTNVGVPNVVTLTVTDVNGNVSTATANVTVKDVINPEIGGEGESIVFNDPSGDGVFSTSDQTTSPLTANPSTFGTLGWFNSGGLQCFGNSSGNYSGAATFEGLFNINPSGTFSTAMTFTDGDVVDASTGSTGWGIISNLSAGTHNVAFRTASNRFGYMNLTYDGSNITINRTVINPTPGEAIIVGSGTGAPDITVNKDLEACGAVVDFNVSSVDNCSSVVTYSQDPGTFFAVGTTTVTATATDPSGNTASTTFDVTVNDTTAPTVITKNITVELDENGNASITPEMINNGSTDACGIASLVVDVTSFDCSNTGENTVTLTATDVHGNEASLTATITVNDVTAPNVVTQDIVVELDASGSAIITADMIDNGSTDACGIASLVLDVTSFDCSNTGENTVTLTATDVHGNQASLTANVTVNDVTAPTVITQNVSVTLADGMATITPEDVNNGSFDNCAFTLSLDNSSFSCGDIGLNTVTLTATDASNNSTSMTAVVNVIGDVPTVAINDFYAVQTQKVNTIFLGFGPQSINLSTAVTGGSGFTYEWTTSTGEVVSNEANPSISPTISTTYNVTVTNSNGCTASTSLYVCVIDARAFDNKGRYKGKVVVCHHTNGKKGTKHVEIEISASAVMTHLTQHGVGTDHADSLGACDATCVDASSAKSQSIEESVSISDNLLVYPNPSTGIFDVQLRSIEMDTNISLFNLAGQLIESKVISKENSFQNIISIGNNNLSSGIYLLKIENENESVIKKVVIN